MTGKRYKIWVWLTLQQIDVLLAAAQVIDATPEAQEAVLPEHGDRVAFRGAIAALQHVRNATGDEQ